MARIIISKKAEKYDKDIELWESRKLGASAKYAIPASDVEEKALDDALGLQLLSLRLNKSLIKQYKKLAKLEGIGYQPLMRQVLTHWANDNEYRLKSKVSKKYRKAV